ncbi:MAG: DUF2269 family protein [Gammaproteobacteria bacterium]|nr:DUF2269 family protein [Gammaproteobacteria bacterium]
MLYSCLKIIHIVSAAILLASMAYCYRLWRDMQTPAKSLDSFDKIQTQTWLIIVPVAVIQLATGFSIINIQHEDLSQTWIAASVIGFITVIASWLSFVYFLLLSQQANTQSESMSARPESRYKFFRRAQFFMLSVCAGALFCMIFFMANKIA